MSVCVASGLHDFYSLHKGGIAESMLLSLYSAMPCVSLCIHKESLSLIVNQTMRALTIQAHLATGTSQETASTLRYSIPTFHTHLLDTAFELLRPITTYYGDLECGKSLGTLSSVGSKPVIGARPTITSPTTNS